MRYSHRNDLSLPDVAQGHRIVGTLQDSSLIYVLTNMNTLQQAARGQINYLPSSSIDASLQ